MGCRCPARSGRRVAARGEIEIQHRPPAGRCNPGQAGEPAIRLRPQSAGERDQLPRRRLAGQLVDGRAAHRAVHGNGRADRRNEDHVAGQEARIVARIAAQQEVVEVEAPHRLPAALELDAPQRADLRHSAARDQRVGDGRERAHDMGAGPLGIAEHVHLDAAQLAERNGNLDADQLFGDAPLEQRAHRFVGLAGDRDRTELREIDPAVPADLQRVAAALLAVELHLEHVARPDHVVARHRHSLFGLRPCCSVRAEQLVAEGLERIHPLQVERQQAQRHVDA